MDRKKVFLLVFFILVVTSVSYLDKNYFRPKKDRKKMIPDFLKYILKKEGGLSRDQKDTAAADPVPVPFKGVTGWHTNKGVTWTTFKNYAKKAGISPAPADVFFKMPYNVWKEIFFDLYFKQAEKYTTSTLFQCVWTWCAWGSGIAGANRFFTLWLKENNAIGIDQLIARIGERAAFLSWYKRRRLFYLRITQYNPSQKRFLKGWYNALDGFYNQFEQYAKN